MIPKDRGGRGYPTFGGGEVFKLTPTLPDLGSGRLSIGFGPANMNHPVAGVILDSPGNNLRHDGFRRCRRRYRVQGGAEVGRRLEVCGAAHLQEQPTVLSLLLNPRCYGEYVRDVVLQRRWSRWSVRDHAAAPNCCSRAFVILRFSRIWVKIAAEALHHVEPRRAGWGEAHMNTRVPRKHFGFLPLVRFPSFVPRHVFSVHREGDRQTKHSRLLFCFASSSLKTMQFNAVPEGCEPRWRP